MVVVVFKYNRLKAPAKYWGGVLNPEKKYYVIKREGNVNPMNSLQRLVK